MKRLLFLIGLISAGLIANGQQLGQHTMWQRTTLTWNPATAGIEDFTDLTGSFRKQWSGFDGSPQQNFLSMHGRLAKMEKTDFKPYSLHISNPKLMDQLKKTETERKLRRHALGGYMQTDRFGPFTRLSLHGAYAYHYPLSKKLTLSGGLSMGVINNRVDQEQLSVLNPSIDKVYQSYLGENVNHTHVNLNVGGFLYSDHFFAGISTNQLLRNKFFDDINDKDGKLDMHHFLMAGYNFEFSDKWELMPTALVKYVFTAPVSFDLNLRARYNKNVFAGFGYRYQESIQGMFGVNLSRLVCLSYAYDYSIGGMSDYNSGSHEVTVSLMLWNKNESPRRLW